MNRYLSSAAILICLVSCTLNEEGNILSNSCPVYTATIEQSDTKVYVDDNLDIRWTADDSISIFRTSTNAKYRFLGETGDADGSFSEVEPYSTPGLEIPTTYAVYPYKESTSISTSGILTIDIPDIQNYAVNSFGPGANTMVAVTLSPDNTSLQFKNLCGYLAFSFWGNGDVKTITLKGNNHEKLAGTGSVTPAYGEEPALLMSDSGKETITLRCGEEGIPLGSTKETATTFWLAVPPVIFDKGFTVTVTDTKGWSMVRSVSSSRSITRNVRNKMAALEAVCDTLVGNVEFDDDKFKAYCLTWFDKDKDGEISLSEARSVTHMDCHEKDIQSLNGIQHFTNLQNLDCSYNRLTTLDFSQNAAMRVLWCEHNQLTALNVSHNPNLYYLLCRDNRLTELDITHNGNLELLYCENNRLTGIDVSNNPSLWFFASDGNSLTSVDVSKNPALKRLCCQGNNLKAIDVSNNTVLEGLCCGGNQLTELDISKNCHLTELHCHENRLTSLDVSKNTALTELLCYKNLLETLDVTKNTELNTLMCHRNQLTTLDITHNPALKCLFCTGNQLTTLDVSKNTALTELLCYENLLETLDVSFNTALQRLGCGENRLTCLDVTHNTELLFLQCMNNRLTDIDISRNTALEDFMCYKNLLTTLNVNQNTALKYLNCNYNRLTALDVSKNAALTGLQCDYNQLTTLDVNQNTALEYLDCSGNKLTVLDVSNLSGLTRLHCDFNLSLTEIWLKTGQTIQYFSYGPTIPRINYRD